MRLYGEGEVSLFGLQSLAGGHERKDPPLKGGPLSNRYCMTRYAVCQALSKCFLGVPWGPAVG